MRISRDEIESGKARLLASPWLAQAERPFADALLSGCLWRIVNDGDLISLGGDTRGGLFALASGRVGIVPANAVTDSGLMHIAPAPFWFGYRPFFTGKGRILTVLARERSLVAALPANTLSKLLEQHPSGWRMMVALAGEHVEAALQWMSDVLLTERYRRCGALLLRLANIRTEGTTGSVIRCSHEELGTMSALSRTSIGEALRHFERQGLIEIGYRAIRITDADGLRRLVDQP